jgi:hypothetical protein
VAISDDSNTTHSISRLFFASVTESNSGEYECVARNNPDPQRYAGQDLQVTVFRTFGLGNKEGGGV